MNKRLKLLIIEDYENDALLVINVLKKDGYNIEWQRVESADAMKNALSNNSFDLIIADYTMPQFNALDALKIMKQQNLYLPFILVSGTIGEETAVLAMKAGAHDFFTKDNLIRLGAAVKREINEACFREEKKVSDEMAKEKEKQWLHTLDAIGHIVIIVSTDDKLLQINKAGCSYLGKSEDQLIGRTCYEIFHNSIKPMKSNHCARSFMLGKNNVAELIHGHKHFKIFSWPTYNNNHEVISYTRIFEDITDQKKTAEKLQLFRSLLDQSNSEVLSR